MKWNILRTVAAVFFVFTFFIQGSSHVKAANPLIDDTFKSIVQIKTYTLDAEGYLVFTSSGSGVIIDSSGIILTNDHVVSHNDTYGDPLDTALQICLTTAIEQKPQCHYRADIIAHDSSLDLALLRIRTISGVDSESVWRSVSISQSDVVIGDMIYAFGYPSIGGTNITITSGSVSGKSFLYNNSWIKTDAVISFGSSGGAGISSDGSLIGITTAVHSDVAGSLGYLINASSFSSWVSAHLHDSASPAHLVSDIEKLTRSQFQLVSDQSTVNADLPYTVTKSSGFTFDLQDENILNIENALDEQGGRIQIQSFESPIELMPDDLPPYLIHRAVSNNGIPVKATDIKDITIRGLSGKSFGLVVLGVESKAFMLVNGSHIYLMLYSYGTGDKDMGVIDTMLNSFSTKVFSPSSKIQTVYTDTNPVLSVGGLASWRAQTQLLNSHPVFFIDTSNHRAFADVNVSQAKTNDTVETKFNEELASIKKLNDLSSLLGLPLEVEILDSTMHDTTIQKEVVPFMIEYVVRDSVDKSIFFYGREYVFLKDGWLMTIELKTITRDEAVFNQSKSSFAHLVDTMAFGSGQYTPPPSSSVPPSTVTSANEIVITNDALYKQLRGRIILRVESHGEAYYIHPTEKKAYYLATGEDAHSIFRQHGVGISNENLKKIPFIFQDPTSSDSDHDLLSDEYEVAIGTDANSPDTDGDGFSDGDEVKNGYSPLLPLGKETVDMNFVKNHYGKIFLAVENRGQAWYVNPVDGNRYYLGKPVDAYAVMRDLGLGISEKDFASLY